jgi:hypothetical protein
MGNREKQFEDKIKQWDLGKNLRKEDIPHLIRLHKRANREGRRVRIKCGGRFITQARIDEYLNRKNQTEDDILHAADANQGLPHYIQIEYLSHEHPPNNSPSQRQQPNNKSPSIQTNPWTSTNSASISNQSTRPATPASFQSSPFEQRSLTIFPTQKKLSTMLDTSKLNVRRPAPLIYASQPELTVSLAESVGSLALSHSLSHFDFSASFNNVVNQTLKPDAPAGSEINELNIWRFLNGSEQIHQKLIQDLSGQPEAGRSSKCK